MVRNVCGMWHLGARLVGREGAWQWRGRTVRNQSAQQHAPSIKQQSQFLLRHTSAPAAILPAGVTLAASHPMSLLLCAAFGKALENYFIPGLIALGVVCGGIAAKSYNDGATAFVKP